MNSSANAKSVARGFTLVEMLVVITIIGILMAMVLGGVQVVRRRGRTAAVETEIRNFDNALTQYQTEFTELPPSFVNINIVAERGGDPVLQAQARDAVIRHLRKAFPRYVPRGDLSNPANTPTPWDRFVFDISAQNSVVNNPAAGVYRNYYNPANPSLSLNPTYFDAASSLVFWLGGLPETMPNISTVDDEVQWIPAGFHSDPEFPFQRGLPRTGALGDFKTEGIVYVELHHKDPANPQDPPDAVPRFLHYYPEAINAPYVYFKPYRVNSRWQYGALNSDTPRRLVQYGYQHAIVAPVKGELPNDCVPYRHPDNPPLWRNHDKCQIICSGTDGIFGRQIPDDGTTSYYRFSITGAPTSNFSREDYNNLANFCRGTLEHEMKRAR